jgi:hypothetical protein
MSIWPDEVCLMPRFVEHAALDVPHGGAFAVGERHRNVTPLQIESLPLSV